MPNHTGKDDRYRGQNERWSSPSRNGNYSDRMDDDHEESRSRRMRADEDEGGMSRSGQPGGRDSGSYQSERGISGRFEEDRYSSGSNYPQERRGDDWQRQTTYPSRYTRGGETEREYGRSEQGGYSREQGEQSRMQYGQTYGGGETQRGAMSGGQYSGVGQSSGEPGRYGQTGYGEGQSGRYGQSGGYRQYGQSSGSQYGQPSGGAQSGQSEQRHDRWSRDQEIHDPDYHEWRQNKMKSYDDDYHAWRSEKQKKFGEDFDTYRKGRDRSSEESKSKSQAGSQSASSKLSS